jgi:hypothetical protein
MTAYASFSIDTPTHISLDQKFFTLFQQATTLAQDSAVQLSAAKAKELGVSAGDVVVLVGRRRHASYGTVEIRAASSSSKKTVCSISQNMASNLRLRQDDKVKVVALEKSFEDENASERSGDLLLLQKQPSKIQSVTFSPVEDSLAALTAMEGGDEIAEGELLARFVTPYLETGDVTVTTTAVLKQGHLIALRDENGKRLEFYISHIDIEGVEAPEKPETEGKGERNVSGCAGLHIH